METCHYSLQISAYHDGELPDGLRREMEQHLAGGCAPCETELLQWRRLSSILAAAPVPRLPVAARQALYQLAPAVREAGFVRLAEWTTALAASVLLVVSTWMVVNRQKSQPAPEPQAWAQMVLNPSQSTDSSTEVRAEPQFANWVAANLSASPNHD